jgi:hypothetical protein
MQHVYAESVSGLYDDTWGHMSVHGWCVPHQQPCFMWFILLTLCAGVNGGWRLGVCTCTGVLLCADKSRCVTRVRVSACVLLDVCCLWCVALLQLRCLLHHQDSSNCGLGVCLSKHDTNECVVRAALHERCLRYQAAP